MVKVRLESSIRDCVCLGEWRSRSSRGRYEHAMWTAAGLEEPRSRWEKQEGREPTLAAEEHGARAFEGDEAMDNLRARTRSGRQ